MPNFSDGYCTDDNARALLAMVLLEEFGGGELAEVKGLASIYLAPIIAPKCCWDLSYCWRE